MHDQAPGSKTVSTPTSLAASTELRGLPETELYRYGYSVFNYRYHEGIHGLNHGDGSMYCIDCTGYGPGRTCGDYVYVKASDQYTCAQQGYTESCDGGGIGG